MNITLIRAVIITILVYSSILTVWVFYKESSSYIITLSEYDFIFAGPVSWVLAVVLGVFYHLKKKFGKEKPFEYKPKPHKYIRDVVEKIVKIYKKKREKYKDKELFDFTMRCDVFCCNNLNGWSDLLVSKPKYEHINKKFETLMLFQKSDTIDELAEYFEVMDDEKIKEDMPWIDWDRTKVYQLRDKEK